MKTHKLFTATITTLIVGALALNGCGRHRSPEERMAHKLDHIAYHLDLNDKQKAKLNEVKDEMLKARTELRQDHETVFDEILVEVKSEQLDQGKLLRLFEQHQAKMAEVAPPVIAKVAEFHATLTPEQKAKAAERLAWVRQKMVKH